MTFRACFFAVLGLAASLHARAQTSVEALERIVITGSRLQRQDGATALPVQVIQREDIDRSGVTTAAELLRQISAVAAQVTDAASINPNVSAQRGLNGANLRGLGVSSTLVLLNGRRLANFASPGDDAGVDLNNIPAGAIERVEVLKDGASAIYGSDAVGGVVNFITHSAYRGAEVGLHGEQTQHGGAGKKAATASLGIGDEGSDGYNVFGVLDLQRQDALRSTQRSFIEQRPLATLLPFYLSSRPYPGNIRLSGDAATLAAQLAAINAAGYRFDGQPYTERTVNLFAPGCSPPASVYASAYLTQACTYDYLEDTQIAPAADKLSFLGRGVLRIAPRLRAYAEVLLAHATTAYVLSPNPTAIDGLTFGQLDANLPRTIADVGTVGLRVRATEAGNRSNTVTSDAARVVAGVEGDFSGAWNYTLAASYAGNRTTDRYVDGYFLYDGFAAGVRAGTINPFGPSNAAGRALIDALRIDDPARKSQGSSYGVDGKVTGTLGRWADGEVRLAVGAELRRETQAFHPSALLNSNNIAGDRDDSGTSPPLVDTRHGRNIVAAYGEIVAPVSTSLELQAAARWDRYQGVGSTVNPKLGVRWQPARALWLRGSAGTGFRAPSFSELYRPTVYGVSQAVVHDPVSGYFDNFPTVKTSNPALKPEKSRQFSFGIVALPLPNMTGSIDYWSIRKRDIISVLDEKTILSDPARYAADIVRDADDDPTLLLKEGNQGQARTSGIDVDARVRGWSTPASRFGASIVGTYVLTYARQFGPGEPFINNAGRFLNDQVIQRWRHRVAVDWDRGSLGASLGNTYYSSYTDDNYLPDTPPGRVPAYSLWDLSAQWQALAGLLLRVGVLNLFDRDPPFSNQGYNFLSTYDPTYTDPRGRTYRVSLKFSGR